MKSSCHITMTLTTNKPDYLFRFIIFFAFFACCTKTLTGTNSCSYACSPQLLACVMSCLLVNEHLIDFDWLGGCSTDIRGSYLALLLAGPSHQLINIAVTYILVNSIVYAPTAAPWPYYETFSDLPEGFVFDGGVRHIKCCLAPLWNILVKNQAGNCAKFANFDRFCSQNL